MKNIIKLSDTPTGYAVVSCSDNNDFETMADIALIRCNEKTLRILEGLQRAHDNASTLISTNYLSIKISVNDIVSFHLISEDEEEALNTILDAKAGEILAIEWDATVESFFDQTEVSGFINHVRMCSPNFVQFVANHHDNSNEIWADCNISDIAKQVPSLKLVQG